MAEQDAKDDRTSSRSARTAADADKFPVADLIARGPSFFGHPSHDVAAGLHGVSEDLSLDDARGRIDAWLSNPATKEA